MESRETWNFSILFHTSKHTHNGKFQSFKPQTISTFCHGILKFWSRDHPGEFPTIRLYWLHVSVFLTPSWQDEPQSMTVNQGSPVEIGCSLSAVSSSVTFEWFYSGTFPSSKFFLCFGGQWPCDYTTCLVIESYIATLYGIIIR